MQVESSKNVIGFLLSLISAITVFYISFFAKTFYTSHPEYDSYQINFLRGIINLFNTFTLVRIKKRKITNRKIFSVRKLSQFLFISLLGAISYYLNLLAIINCRISTFHIITNIWPLFSFIFSFFILKKIPSRTDIMCFITTLFFSLLIIENRATEQEGHFDSVFGIACCFSFSVLFSLIQVMKKKLSGCFAVEMYIAAEAAMLLVFTYPVAVLFRVRQDVAFVSLEHLPEVYGMIMISFLRELTLNYAVSIADLIFVQPIQYLPVILGLFYGHIVNGDEIKVTDIVASLGIFAVNLWRFVRDVLRRKSKV